MMMNKVVNNTHLLFFLTSCILPFTIFTGCSNTQLPTSELSSSSPLDYLASLPTVISAEPSSITFSDISYDSITIHTAHYTIHTTATDRLILRRLPMLLESAYLNYSKFAPPADTSPGTIYYFKNRDQWLAYTKHLTGTQSTTFEKIHSGAYCYQHTCVAWQITRSADFSVLAHEAWHQYCGLNLPDTLPSWLAESSAVYLESFSWNADGLKFSPKYNLNRLWDLNRTMAAGISISLSNLLQSDPGSILDKTPNLSQGQRDLIAAAYYARLYALARFLYEYEYGIYRKGYQSIFLDAAQGKLNLSQQLRSAHGQYSQTRLWQSRAGLDLFNSYIAQPDQDIESQYQTFCADLASTIRKK